MRSDGSWAPITDQQRNDQVGVLNVIQKQMSIDTNGVQTELHQGQTADSHPHALAQRILILEGKEARRLSWVNDQLQGTR